MAYIITSDNRGSISLSFDTLEQAKSALLEIFETDAALEGAVLDPDLIAQINALTDLESGVELHGYGVTEIFRRT